MLKWGSHSEAVIDVYSAIEHHETGDFKISRGYTVDGVIARLEGVLVRECEKGGTAASIKAAMDRAIDQLHAETSGTRDRARDAVVRTADKLREKFDREARERRLGGFRSDHFHAIVGRSPRRTPPWGSRLAFHRNALQTIFEIAPSIAPPAGVFGIYI